MTRHALSATVVAVLSALASVSVGAAGNNANVSLVDAVRRADMSVVRTLLKAGADVNAATPDGSSALHWAVQQGDRALVDLLVASGARVEVANRYGVTPVALAAENGDGVILERLLKAGGSAGAKLDDGDTPIAIAARTGRVDALQALLAHGASPNVTTTHGQTPLMWAASRNNAAAVKLLVEAGAKIDARTPVSQFRTADDRTAPQASGFTALLFAVRAGAVDAVRALVDAGSAVNDVLSDGESALVVAAANARWDVADLLLDRGADPNLDGAGWNALHQAVRIRRPNTGFGTPGPIPTGTIDSIDVVRKIIAKGVNINARMANNAMKDGQRNRLIRTGATAFLLAAKNTDTEVMRVLLANGADPTIPNGELSTPLMVAAGLHIWNPGEDGGSLAGQEDEVLAAVKMCVESGNDVNAANHEGWTALHGAAFRGINAVVEYLVSQGARLDAKTYQGWTAWSIANGLTYTEFYKHQPHTAGLLAKLMQDRRLPTGPVVDPTICLDCAREKADMRAREQFALEQLAMDTREELRR
jgi:ankyrin